MKARNLFIYERKSWFLSPDIEEISLVLFLLSHRSASQIWVQIIDLSLLVTKEDPFSFHLGNASCRTRDFWIMGSGVVSIFASQGKAWALKSDTNLDLPLTDDPHCVSVSFSVKWDNDNNNKTCIIALLCVSNLLIHIKCLNRSWFTEGL